MMNTARDAFVLFFGINWALAVSLAGRYQLFDTTMFFGDSMRRRALARFLCGMFFLNLLPLAWFIVLHHFLGAATGMWGIVGSGVASLSFYAFHRLLHAFVASDNAPLSRWLYTDAEKQAVLENWRPSVFSGAARDSTQTERTNLPNTFCSHFIPGALFLAFYAIVGVLVAC